MVDKGKSHLEMDDDYGYPSDSGNLRFRGWDWVLRGVAGGHPRCSQQGAQGERDDGMDGALSVQGILTSVPVPLDFCGAIGEVNQEIPSNVVMP